MPEPLTPIHWREGLFLRPHHLQESAAYSNRRLQYHLSTISPYHIGVREVEIDEGRLEDGMFVIRKLEAILPSGEVIQYPGNTRLEARKIIEPGPGRESRMKAYIGVRRLREQEPNVSEGGPEDPDPGRYQADSHLVYDMNSGRDSQELEYKFLNARIFFEDEPMEEYDTLAIAEIVPPEVGLPLSQLSKRFIPTCVCTGASKVLSTQVRQLHAAAAGKAGRLTARADAEGVRSGTAVQGDVLSLWKLHTLQGCMPFLRDAVELGEIHPYPVFLELCRLAGQLSSFSTSQAAVELPMYDHLDPETCFGQILPIIHRLLDELIPSNFAKIPLTQEGFRFSADLREEWLEIKNRFYVVLNSELPEALIERWFRGTGKIASRSGIEGIVIQRLRGVPTNKCARPRVLPPREGPIYFELDRDAQEWAKVRSERAIAVHLAAEAGMTPEALAAMQMEMYVVFG